MGIFDFIFGKKEQPAPTPPPTANAPIANTENTDGSEEEFEEEDDVEVQPGLIMPAHFARHWKEIAATKMDTITITASPKANMSLKQSKFGHYPYMPADYDYPTDSEGKFMFPLAQINCSELPVLKGYPTSGYLQFYVCGFDDSYGIDFDDPQSQRDSRVLYFEEDAIKKPKEDFAFLDDVMDNGTNAVDQPYALAFQLEDEYIGLGDIRAEKRMKEFSIEDVVEEAPVEVYNKLEEYVNENYISSGHKMGGYAYFTQWDPRGKDEKFDDYILLLQIDSDNDIMWGDVGVANFFIHPDDLAKKDFSKVMYTWDCS